MPQPLITYANKPWGDAGATWQTNYAGNFGTQTTMEFQNQSGGTLFTGDVVVLGTGATIPEVTAYNITTTTTVSSPYVVGVVGGLTNQVAAGGLNPFQLAAWRYDAVSINNSVTVTDAATVSSDLGKAVIGTGIPSGAYIVSVTAGVSFNLNVATTGGALTPTLAIGPATASVGPGWTGFPAGEIAPVVLQGWAYVNVGANTVAAGNLLTTSGVARVGSAVTSAATLIGTFIGVALEAQNAAGTVTSADGSASRLVRSWIAKM